jgi:hypothetical protein
VNPVPPITTVSSDLDGGDRWDHLQARVGYRRSQHLVAPGLYKAGDPTRASPVFVSANYTLSFDALRTSLKGIDAYILVLDTKGINVWCAAGKGTFGTKEIIAKVGETGLADVVDHRKLILPQLSAPGVAAHEVKKEMGFTVEYGPVRAMDIPEYLRIGKATDEMRRVTFPLKDRALLTPVELVQSLKYLVPAVLLLFLVGGSVAAAIAVVAVLGGTVLFPLLLPYLPTNEFTSKGLVLGMVLSVPFLSFYLINSVGAQWATLLLCASVLLLMAAVVGYFGLNFTGCSTYASRTGVRREIYRWMPVMATMLIIGAVLLTISIGSQMGWY